MTYRFSEASIKKMTGVHPALQKVMCLAISKSKIDFKITEGLRTTKRQQELLTAGATKTMNSRHITGHAVDVAALVGKCVRWDWPLYSQIAEAVKAAAKECDVTIVWGGDWRTFKDGPHFELCRKRYPA